jgi:5'-nucleotidase
MNILMTNDDGIDSDGLQKLAKLLRSSGKHRVFVIAPDINRSGISNALALINGPVKVSTIGEDSWSCSGFPADCIVLALKGIIPLRPDIVISGINRGSNLGSDIIYSGTASAARQASLSGIPAIAISLVGYDPYHWDMAASWSVEHLEELLKYWKSETFLNVNIPNEPDYPKGVETTWPASKSYRDSLKIVNTRGDAQWCFLEGGEEIVVSEAGSDCYTVSRNFVSVSTILNYPAVLDRPPAPKAAPKAFGI